MSLLDEIIEAATDDKVPIGTLLRKCLVLERQLKNEKFKAWLDQELDGYNQDNPDDFPDYRVFNCVNKGDFYGMTVKMTGQPISLHVMTEKDRKLLEKVYLHQPVASYESRPGQDSDAALPWNPYLIAKYQTKIYQNGEPALMRAWQEIPGSVLVALLEQVRTRVLRFALDLKEGLPAESATASSLPAATVEKSVVNHIYGGNIVIASHAENISQLAHMQIAVGDTAGLKKALEILGVSDEGIKQLESDIEAEKESVGPRVRKWIANAGAYLGKEGAKAGVDAAKKLATKWILQRYGIDLG